MMQLMIFMCDFAFFVFVVAGHRGMDAAAAKKIQENFAACHFFRDFKGLEVVEVMSPCHMFFRTN